jgi:heme/copper-type cytochrome/quinol oxidase subunit 3
LFEWFFSGLAMRAIIKSTGFTPPTNRTLGSERRNVVAAELIASIGLAVSTLVAATVVSIGIARADVASNVIDNESGVFAIALLLGLLFIGMGGLTFLSLPHHRHKKTHS